MKVTTGGPSQRITVEEAIQTSKLRALVGRWPLTVLTTGSPWPADTRRSGLRGLPILVLIGGRTYSHGTSRGGGIDGFKPIFEK